MKTSILEYLEESARKYPDKTAFADEHTSCTFKELEQTARRTGTALAKHFTPRNPVPVFMEKSVETIGVFMGAEDIERQKLNVFRMEMLGAKVQPVTTGSATLKDATNEAIRTWAERAEDTFYIIGSAVGPHPYPKMVKEFQRIISTEARKQILEKTGKLPDAVVACVGGGSNSIGMFADFINDKDVDLIGVEAGGLGIETGKHASAMALGQVGVLHGMKTYLLQDEIGNIQLAHSISAGLDYPGVGPEHAYLRDSGRAKYVSVTDKECMDALMELCRMEGIIPAIESAHALAHVFKMAQGEYKGKTIIMCLSGRGDKDVNTVQKYLNGEETNK